MDGAERAANLAGSLRVTRPATGPPAPCALLVDDIVTTGATLAEAARALRSAGTPVPLAITVAQVASSTSGRRRLSGARKKNGFLTNSRAISGVCCSSMAPCPR